MCHQCFRVIAGTVCRIQGRLTAMQRKSLTSFTKVKPTSSSMDTTTNVKNEAKPKGEAPAEPLWRTDAVPNSAPQERRPPTVEPRI